MVLVALNPLSETVGPDSGLSSNRMPPMRKSGRLGAKEGATAGMEASISRSVVRLSRISFYA